MRKIRKFSEASNRSLGIYFNQSGRINISSEETKSGKTRYIWIQPGAGCSIETTDIEYEDNSPGSDEGKG